MDVNHDLKWVASPCNDEFKSASEHPSKGLNKGSSFLFLSERTGWRRLYLIPTANASALWEAGRQAGEGQEEEERPFSESLAVTPEGLDVVWCCAVLYCAVLYSVVLCCTVLYCTVLYITLL